MTDTRHDSVVMISTGDSRDGGAPGHLLCIIVSFVCWMVTSHWPHCSCSSYILLCNTILVVTGLSRAFLFLNSTGLRHLIKMHYCLWCITEAVEEQ